MIATKKEPRTYIRLYVDLESQVAGDDAIAEVTSAYQRVVPVDGMVDIIEVTYYVVRVLGSMTNQPGDDDLWAIRSSGCSYVRRADDGFGEPFNEDYSSLDGSPLWYRSEDEAIVALKRDFTYDESWKLNPIPFPHPFKTV